MGIYTYNRSVQTIHHNGYLSTIALPWNFDWNESYQPRLNVISREWMPKDWQLISTKMKLELDKKGQTKVDTPITERIFQ